MKDSVLGTLKLVKPDGARLLWAVVAPTSAVTLMACVGAVGGGCEVGNWRG